MVGQVCAMSYTCRSCACNAHNAMCNRHGAKAPPFTASFDWFIECFETWEHEVAAMYHDHLTEFGDAWADRWSESKRKQIDYSVRDDCPQPWKVKCMVKRECGHKKPSKARCIQFYPNLSTQEMYARETASLQKSWCAFMRRARVDPKNPNMRVTFSSGMNAAQLGDWATEVLKDYDEPWFYERDGKNWDATMGEQHHKLKFRCYKMAGADYVQFAEKASKVSGLGVFGDNVLRYTLEFTTKSGHNDTTLGNNIVNAAITCSSLRGKKCDILIAGDDLLVVVEGEIDGREIAEEESKYGIVPEARVFRSIEDASYISGLFAITEQGVKFLARPGRMLANLFWTVKPPSLKPEKLRAYQRGVAKGVLPTMSCVPVVGPWLRQVGDDGPTIQDRSRRVYTYGAEVKADFEPWFTRRYGLTQADIKEATDLLVNTCGERCFVNCHALETICAIDFADLEEREENGEF